MATVDDAWGTFLLLLDAGIEADRGVAVTVDDAQRASLDFVGRHRGRLEERLLGSLGELVGERLDELCRFGVRDEHWVHPVDPVVAAMDPHALLAIVAQVLRLDRDRFASEPDFADYLAAEFAIALLERTGLGALTTLRLPPEVIDVLRARVAGTPLPDILPKKLARRTVDEIEDLLVQYTGLAVDVIERRMRPGGLSASGFLAEGQRLAEVILEDARTLARLRVDRRDVADRIQAAIAAAGAETRRGKRVREQNQIDVVQYVGYQQDPFHSVDVFEVNHLGAQGFRIASRHQPELRISSGNLVVSLIRRAGFFEGAVPCRVEPSVAVAILDL